MTRRKSSEKPIPGFIWLTTAPNPRSPGTGFDAGQRGWKLHLMKGDQETKFSDIRYQRSLCGILPGHGWSLDLFIEDKCSRCMKALAKLTCSE